MESRPRRRKVKYKVNSTIIILFIILIIGSIGLFAILQTVGDEFIQTGIYIDNEPVGGMDKNEVTNHLINYNRQRIDDFELRLSYGGNQWVFNHFDINGSLDVDDAVDQAFTVGQKGNFFNRIVTIYKLRKDPVKLYSQFNYDKERLKSEIEKISRLIDKAPVEASVEFYPDREVIFVIIPEELGLEVNAEKIIESVDRELLAGYLNIDLSFEPDTIVPEVTAAGIEGRTVKLVSFGTDLSNSSPDRTYNVEKAALTFNGMVVWPGRVVSFNGTTGERTLDNGYKNAPVIKADKSLQDAPGGGVSQTSTTLYNAVLRAGLEIVEFTRHSFPSSYIGKGLDTTVNLPVPVIDLKFRNSKDFPIYIRSFYSEQRIYFEIYGQPLPDGREIRIRTEEYETVPAPDPEYISDEEGKHVTYEDEQYEHVKSRQGYKVRVYREVYQDGDLVESELIDDHYYRPIKGIIYTGIEKKVETETDQTPTIIIEI